MDFNIYFIYWLLIQYSLISILNLTKSTTEQKLNKMEQTNKLFLIIELKRIIINKIFFALKLKPF
jgi:hypothetical protein